MLVLDKFLSKFWFIWQFAVQLSCWFAPSTKCYLFYHHPLHWCEDDVLFALCSQCKGNSVKPIITDIHLRLKYLNNLFLLLKSIIRLQQTEYTANCALSPLAPITSKMETFWYQLTQVPPRMAVKTNRQIVL